jgi:virginiamycin B lyase
MGQRGPFYISRIMPQGVVTRIYVGVSLGSVITGPDRSLWSTTGNDVCRITPQSGISSIAVGADGNLWFTETDASNIGRITSSGVITEFP